MLAKSLVIFIGVGVLSGFLYGAYLIDLKSNTEPIFVDGPSISVLTEKSDYKKGEEIKIRIVNSGTVPIMFSDASFGLRITGLSGILMYSPTSAQVISTLEPNQEIEFVWDQIKNDGDAALEGLYKIHSKGADQQGNKIEKSTTINIWK